MASVSVRPRDYGLFLTDGYLSGELLARRAKRAYQASKREQLPLERLAAQRLYQLGKRKLAPPHPLHVWVVGKDDWLGAVPEPVKPIVENEADRSYRIVIAGLGIPPRYVGAWSDHVYAAGIQRRKRHSDISGFRDAGHALLTTMADYFDHSKEDPSPVLRHLGLPFEFVGD